MRPWTSSASTDARRSGAGTGRGGLPAWLRALRAALFVLALLPLARLVLAGTYGWFGGLGANPVELVTRSTGTWTLVCLVATLAVTPLRRATGLHALVRLRRMLGLFAFLYGALHFTTYLWFDQWFDLQAIAKDVLRRPFITMGFVAFVLMLPLAATSFNRAIRALGPARWQALHRAVYAAALLALLHFFWMRAGKNDFAEVGVYAAVIGALLGWRLWRR